MDLFALQLRGPFGAGVRAGFSPCYRSLTAVSALTRPLRSLYYDRLGWIISKRRELSRTRNAWSGVTRWKDPDCPGTSGGKFLGAAIYFGALDRER